MSISKLNNVSWSSIVKVDGITKASIAKVAGVTTGPPIQYATLNATKYATYSKSSTTSWAIAIGSLSSDTSQTVSLAINSQTAVGRTSTVYNNARTNIQYDLSSYSAYTILSMKLIVNVTGLTVNNTTPALYATDLSGNTFSYPTTANSDYSIYKQSGAGKIYVNDIVDAMMQYELTMTSVALDFANTFPSAFSMALVTRNDFLEVEPNLNTQYYLGFDVPQLYIEYQ